MKISYVSDLHFEFFYNNTVSYEAKISLIKDISKCKSDVMVIAGDLNVAFADKIYKDLLLIYKFYKRPIIFICGNHEYYRTQKNHLDSELNLYKHPEITILNNSYCILENTIFIGSTGWWDESGGPLTPHCIKSLNDFVYIRDIQQNHYGINWGIQSKAFFKSVLSDTQLNKYSKVCISHNSPLINKKDPYFGSKINTCFHNNWTDLFEDFEIDYWIHGHCHSSRNQTFKNCKIVCNPYGYYKHDQNLSFKNKIIRI